jgi:hypothetical protein
MQVPLYTRTQGAGATAAMRRLLAASQSECQQIVFIDDKPRRGMIRKGPQGADRNGGET